MARTLTAKEIHIARILFKNAIDYDKVKIHNGKYFVLQTNNSAMVPNGEIYACGIYSDDYTKETGAMRGFFIHEMTHVWQYQNKICNMMTAAVWEFLKCGLNYEKTYHYKLDTDKELVTYGMEQQAAIIEDYYRMSVEGLACRSGRIQNIESGTELKRLYKSVLCRFLLDPSLCNE